MGTLDESGGEAVIDTVRIGMQRFEFHIGKFVLHFYAEDFNGIAMLNEAKHKGVPLHGPYSVQKHSAHVQPGERHVHVYLKNNQLFALNMDSGTAHDQSHGIPIPNKVADALRQKFPDITLPPNNFIESASLTAQIRVTLAEADEL
jgi:hypothetical protein